MTPTRAQIEAVKHRIGGVSIEIVDQPEKLWTDYPLVADELIVQLDPLTPVALQDWGFVAGKVVTVSGGPFESGQRNLLFKAFRDLTPALKPKAVFFEIPGKGTWMHDFKNDRGRFL